jgi:hypothetical protein
MHSLGSRRGGGSLLEVWVLVLSNAVRCLHAALWPDRGFGRRRRLVIPDLDDTGLLTPAVAGWTYETAAVRLCYCVGIQQGLRAIVGSAQP